MFVKKKMCGHCCWVSIICQWWFLVMRVSWLGGKLMPRSAGLLDFSVTEHKMLNGKGVLVLCSPYSWLPGSDQTGGHMQVLVCVCSVSQKSYCGQFSVLMHYMWGKKKLHSSAEKAWTCFFPHTETNLFIFCFIFRGIVQCKISNLHHFPLSLSVVSQPRHAWCLNLLYFCTKAMRQVYQMSGSFMNMYGMFTTLLLCLQCKT